jgi:phosphate transport system substrate-binding protein
MAKKLTFVFLGLLILTAIAYSGYLIWKPVQAQVTILIAGSSTVDAYTQVLAEEYIKKHPNVTIDHIGGGSTPGLLALKKGAIDLATMSRTLKWTEEDEYTRQYLIGKNGVAIGVHLSNPVKNLTKNQVYQIMSGKITNWSEVGGNNAEIQVLGRAKGSTTRIMIEDLVMQGAPFTETLKSFTSADELRTALEGNPNAIGILGLQDSKDTIKRVTIEGVDMTPSTILSNRYPLTRSFYFVWHSEPGAAEAEKHKLDFLNFVRSEEGQKIIEKRGGVRVY